MSVPHVFCDFIGDLLGQADGYVAQHALGGGVRDVLQGALEDERLVVSGLVDLQGGGTGGRKAGTR